MNISTLNKQYKLAKRYAVALFKLGEENILSELQEIIDVLTQNPDLKNFLENKIVKIEDKKEIFEKVFNEISEKTKNFCFTLLDNKKIDHIYSIYVEYSKMINAKNNIQEATIVSAIELTDGEKAKIKSKLENKFKKEFNITNTINKEIISGLVIKIEDTLIDLSLRAKLNTLKKQII